MKLIKANLTQVLSLSAQEMSFMAAHLILPKFLANKRNIHPKFCLKIMQKQWYHLGLEITQQIKFHIWAIKIKSLFKIVEIIVQTNKVQLTF